MQGFAAGEQGDELATALALQKQQLKSGQLKLQQEGEGIQARNVFAKAISEVLGAGGQTAASSPAAPPAGALVAPGGGPATPSEIAATKAPTPAQTGAGPQSPTAATLGVLGDKTAPAAAAGAPSLQVPQAPTAALDSSAILQKIISENPNLPPGILSDVINDQILPLMDSQAKARMEQFKAQLEVEKLDSAHQDRVLALGLRMEDEQSRHEDRMAALDARIQATQEAAANRATSLADRQQNEADRRQEAADRLAETTRHDKEMENLKQQTTTDTKDLHKSEIALKEQQTRYDKIKADLAAQGKSLPGTKVSTGPTMDQQIMAAKDRNSKVASAELLAALAAPPFAMTARQRQIVADNTLSQKPLSTNQDNQLLSKATSAVDAAKIAAQYGIDDQIVIDFLSAHPALPDK
jgi:hypothetical protein